ncbi:MAG TPA: SCP2 sterol-binding domain-containing protein [Candidatus Limnocylindrales bacterium]|nr:SCP2 sterol-binding domain-containing protein [Candidatus Limnocylindrales bacterium]
MRPPDIDPVASEIPPRRIEAPTTHAEWKFPFPAPGRPRRDDDARIAPRTAYAWPFRPIDAERLPGRGVKSPVPLAEFKNAVATWADDVGVISIDDPAIAHEIDEIRYVYPHARSLVCLIGEENKPSMQSRYLPAANHELYSCEERIFAMGHRTIAYIRSLGGESLTTTIGWPQEVSQRWADKIWPLSHKLVAQAAGLGVIGTSRNFLHRKFGAYCLIDTVVTNLEFDALDSPVEWNPCLSCNLCVASCPTEAIKPDGDFDFFACYNHTYRDSIPGFLDIVHDLSRGNAKRFRKRWNNAEIAALWQALAYKVEYRCFNCVATCPAEMHEAFHADRNVRRRYLDETLKPLSHTRSVEDEQFVIDTPSARERLGIAPGEWRTAGDAGKPASRTTRLIPLSRISSLDVDAMMRNMPHFFRAEEAGDLDFTTQFRFHGSGRGDWILRIQRGRAEVRTGTADAPDLEVACEGRIFLEIQQGTRSAPWALLTGKVRLSGDRRLFLKFPAVFALDPAEGPLARAMWHARRWLRKGRAAADARGPSGT